MPNARPQRAVIGIGNPERGDDAAGRAVARMLKDRLQATVAVTEHSGESASLLDLLDGVDEAILIDACVSGATPGTLHRFDVSAAPLPKAKFSLSTHGLGLAEALELARALGRLPPRTIVYAIEAGSFDTGAPLSPAVAAAVGEACARLCAEFGSVERDAERRAVRTAR